MRRMTTGLKSEYLDFENIDISDGSRLTQDLKNDIIYSISFIAMPGCDTAIELRGSFTEFLFFKGGNDNFYDYPDNLNVNEYYSSQDQSEINYLALSITNTTAEPIDVLCTVVIRANTLIFIG